ncbi:hypothetical protein FRC02_012407 [Tulasnella sp. 418]|nr:hypothetical protein FRC02_012407 [Tulasnella sp. 418]
MAHQQVRLPSIRTLSLPQTSPDHHQQFSHPPLHTQSSAWNRPRPPSAASDTSSHAAGVSTHPASPYVHRSSVSSVAHSPYLQHHGHPDPSASPPIYAGQKRSHSSASSVVPSSSRPHQQTTPSLGATAPPPPPSNEPAQQPTPRPIAPYPSHSHLPSSQSHHAPTHHYPHYSSQTPVPQHSPMAPPPPPPAALPGSSSYSGSPVDHYPRHGHQSMPPPPPPSSHGRPSFIGKPVQHAPPPPPPPPPHHYYQYPPPPPAGPPYYGQHQPYPPYSASPNSYPYSHHTAGPPPFNGYGRPEHPYPPPYGYREDGSWGPTGAPYPPAPAAHPPAQVAPPLPHSSHSLPPPPVGTPSQVPPQPVPQTANMESPMWAAAERARASGRVVPIIMEHCHAIMSFATYYAATQHQPPNDPTTRHPMPHEMQEMATRASIVVYLLHTLHKEEMAANKKKAVAAAVASFLEEQSAAKGAGISSSGPKRIWEETKEGSGVKKPSGESTFPTGDDAEAFHRPALQAIFGDNKEAQEIAERDMRTIRTKRSLSQGGLLPPNKGKYKKRSRASPPGKCHSCNITETPEWRRGPDGARTLCNACGLHYAKLVRKRDAARPKRSIPGGPHIDIATLQGSSRPAPSAALGAGGAGPPSEKDSNPDESQRIKRARLHDDDDNEGESEDDQDDGDDRSEDGKEEEDEVEPEKEREDERRRRKESGYLPPRGTSRTPLSTSSPRPPISSSAYQPWDNSYRPPPHQMYPQEPHYAKTHHRQSASYGSEENDYPHHGSVLRTSHPASSSRTSTSAY